MSVTLSTFLYLYTAFILVWIFFIVVAVYHMLRFGFKNFTTWLVTFIFIIVAMILFLVSIYYINQIDWNTEIELFKSFFNQDVII